MTLKMRGQESLEVSTCSPAKPRPDGTWPFNHRIKDWSKAGQADAFQYPSGFVSLRRGMAQIALPC